MTKLRLSVLTAVSAGGSGRVPHTEGRSQEAEAQSFHKIEEEDVMARIVEFYIPTSFRRKVTPVQHSQPGKLIEFSLPAKKSA
jgi:hypothetical protein